MIKTIFFSLFAFSLLCCNSNTGNSNGDNGIEPPGDQEITEIVIHENKRMNMILEGGTPISIKKVIVIKKWPDTDKYKYHATVIVKGVRGAAALPDPPPDEAFEEERELMLVYKNGKWEDMYANLRN